MVVFLEVRSVAGGQPGEALFPEGHLEEQPWGLSVPWGHLGLQGRVSGPYRLLAEG